jgi:hypothetical protein
LRSNAQVFKPLNLDREYNAFLADRADKQSTTSPSTTAPSSFGTVTPPSETPSAPGKYDVVKIDRKKFQEQLKQYQATALGTNPSSPSQQSAIETPPQSKPSSPRAPDSPPRTMESSELQSNTLFKRQASQESLPDMFPSSAVSSPASSGTTTPKGDRFPVLRPAEFQDALKEVEKLRQLEETGQGTERQPPPRPDRPYPYEAPVVSSTSTASVKPPATPARFSEAQKSVAPASSTGSKPLSKVQELIRQREAAAKDSRNPGGH